MSDHDDEPIVHLSTHSSAALAEPRFIVKVGDVYYVTLAAWAYDRKKAKTEAHHKGIDEVEHLFRHSKPVEARVPPTKDPFGAGHTSPGGTDPTGTGTATGTGTVTGSGTVTSGSNG